MSANQTAILVAVISGVAAGAISGFVTLRKVRRDLEAQYDTQVRAKRLEVYTTMWKQLVITSQAFGTRSETSVTRKQLAQLFDDLTTWFYDEAGMYLSQDSTQAYGFLQITLNEVTHGPYVSATDEPLTMSEWRAVGNAANMFRLRLTEDVGTKRPSAVYKTSLRRRFQLARESRLVQRELIRQTRRQR